MSKEKLIIFVKNEEAGKVKTRLAKEVGDEKALEIYQKLLSYTYDQVSPLPVTKEVCYSRFIEENDLWGERAFLKQLQKGEGLGERMSEAFRRSFDDEGFQKTVIIGSDCAELTLDILKEAFARLNDHEIVLGPAADGGYYLLGMKSYFPELFTQIAWSTGSVLEKTINKAEKLGKDYTLLKQLNDVDRLEDWKQVEARFPSKL